MPLPTAREVAKPDPQPPLSVLAVAGRSRVDVQGKIAVLEQQVRALKLVEVHNDRLEREIGILRREMARLQTGKRSTDLELLESRRALRDIELKLAKMKGTISYQLGSALVDANKSWRDAARLPMRLVDVYRSAQALRIRRARSRDTIPASITQASEAAHLVTTAVSMVTAESGERAAAWARDQNAKPSVLAYTLIEIAKAACLQAPQLAAHLGSEAIDIFPAENRVKLLAFQLADLGHIRHAVTLVNKAAVAGAAFNASEARKAEHLRALQRLLDSPPIIPTPSKIAADLDRRHVALIGRHMVPFDVSTAALRLRDRARHMRNAGFDVTVVTPPGYPSDIRGRHPLLAQDQWVDANGIRHVRLKATEHSEDIADLYLFAAAASIAQAVIGEGASLIHAEGSFVHGVAAALAARSVGCPLIIEINDLLDPAEPYYDGYERTERGQMSLWMSLIAARAADVCIVSNERLAYVLAEAGITRNRIVLAPHAFDAIPVDAGATAALSQELGLQDGPVIGVVRDLCDTYDSAVLADVLAGLSDEFPTLKLLVVGQGRAGDALRKRAASFRLGDRLVIVEKPDADRIPHYRRVLDVAIFTRTDTTKTAMLSAYEVAAAMAEGCAIAAYRSSDAAELIEDGTSGLLSVPGDATELTHNVRRLLKDRSMRTAFGAAAKAAYRLSCGEERAATMAHVYTALLPADRPALS